MGAFADTLVRDIRNSARAGFVEAALSARDKVRAVAPKDTGNLKGGINQVGTRILTGNVFSITYESTARSIKGTDYPAILENAGPRISPKKGKYLTFRVGGQYRSVPFIENKHDKWWTLAWGINEPPTLWDTCLKEAFERKLNAS